MTQRLLSGDVGGVFAAMLLQSFESREEQAKRIKISLSKGRERDAEALARRQAEYFLRRFPSYLRAAMLKKIHLELDPGDSCEDPGFRGFHLGRTRGWILVHEFGRDQSNNTKKSVSVPLWVRKALEKLTLRGFDCEVKEFSYSDSGCGGGELVGYICLRDPRVPRETAISA